MNCFKILKSEGNKKQLDSTNISYYGDRSSLLRSADEMKNKILDAIEEEMERQDLSQAQLGEIIGMPRNKVNNILRGTERAVSFKKVVDIANAIGLEVDVKVRRKNK